MGVGKMWAGRAMGDITFKLVIRRDEERSKTAFGKLGLCKP